MSAHHDDTDVDWPVVIATGFAEQRLDPAYRDIAEATIRARHEAFPLTATWSFHRGHQCESQAEQIYHHNSQHWHAHIRNCLDDLTATNLHLTATVEATLTATATATSTRTPTPTATPVVIEVTRIVTATPCVRGGDSADLQACATATPTP